MNVYDFDKTIYDGDSTLDFFLFCLHKEPILFCSIPMQIWGLAGYKIGKYNKTQFKEYFFCFLKYLSDVDRYVELFWNKHEDRIKEWYLVQKRKDDLIISASPDFLLRTICRRLGIAYLIASEVDKHTGKFEGINCKGVEKVKRFKHFFPQGVIENFYSDSVADLPMAKLAKKAFLVKGNTLEQWIIKEDGK